MAATPFATRYRQAYPLRAREVFREVALSIAAGGQSLWGRVASDLARPRVQILYLHHVFDDETGGFRRLLETLGSRGQRFCSYSEALERIWNGRIDAPYVALTFDDGLRSCLQAAEVMREFGIPGCFFVCPSIPEERNLDVLARFCREKLHKPPLEFLSWNDLERLRTNGHEIGSHTRTHSNLASLAPSQMEDEIGNSRRELIRRLGEARHFSWPYGRFHHFSEAARAAVFNAGYESCASAERGCHVRATTPRELLVRRDLVVARWPVRHVLYFLARNSRCAS
jgi:peptidoglycan/xylan/chitin deacetylase (PgdA/CDA1 family)